MKGKLLFVGIIAAFVALAIFAREPNVPASSEAGLTDEVGAGEGETTKRGKGRKGRKRGKKQRQRRDIETPENPIPPGRFDDENSERRATSFYRHAKIASNRWQALGNELQNEGRDALSESAKTLARALRRARRRDAKDADQGALLEQEQALIETMRNTELSADQVQQVERLAKAATRVGSTDAQTPTSQSEANDDGTAQEIP